MVLKELWWERIIKWNWNLHQNDSILILISIHIHIHIIVFLFLCCGAIWLELVHSASWLEHKSAPSLFLDALLMFSGFRPLAEAEPLNTPTDRLFQDPAALLWNIAPLRDFLEAQSQEAESEDRPKNLPKVFFRTGVNQIGELSDCRLLGLICGVRLWLCTLAHVEMGDLDDIFQIWPMSWSGSDCTL